MSEKKQSASFSSSDVDISTGSVLTPDHENEDEIIGYTEPWIARPGQEVAVKVRRPWSKLKFYKVSSAV